MFPAVSVNDYVVGIIIAITGIIVAVLAEKKLKKQKLKVLKEKK